MSYIEKYTDASGDLFIKYPLINNLLNDRGWRTTAEANAAYAKTVIGTAFALMPNPEEAKYSDGHPFRKTDEANIQEEIDYAFQYAIGQNVGVTTESGQYKGASGEIPYFGIARITDPDAKTELQKPDSQLMPKAVSAGIIQEEGPDEAITKYHIVHVAAVSKGAYGPKFVHLAKCNGDALSCLPALKAASYKERNHICPLQVLSSYAQKSGSSDVITMSAVNNTSTPGPQTFGTGTMTTTYPDSNQQNQSTPSTKPTIRIKKRLPLGLESEENGQQQEQPEGNNGEQEQQLNNEQQQQQQQQQTSVESVQKELAQLRKQYEAQSNIWKQDKMRREIQDAIPKALFTDPKGRFREKDWQKEVDARLQQGLPIETIHEIYQTKLQLLEVPEIAITGKSKRASSIALPRGASSQYDAEDEEKRMKLNELGRMIRGS